MIDTNTVIRAHIVANAGLLALVSTRIYCPRLIENATLPAISFFTRGGSSTPYIPGWLAPSVQFDCWADSQDGARAIYRALYDCLQGIQNTIVSISGTDYYINSCREEVQGQDLVDQEIQGYFRTLAFFEFVMR